LTSSEKVARALCGQPLFSKGLLQQFADVFTATEHRLRNLLHQGILTAYYFSGLFHPDRHAVAREFWATTEADGVLISGTYLPFGRPRTWHEQRPSHPLFLLQSELTAALSDEPKSPLRKSDVTNALHDDADNSYANSIATTPKTEIENSALNEADNTAANSGRAEEISSSCRRKSRPSLERAKRVIDELYPDGVPDQATVSNKKLCQRVREKITEAVSSDTILRAAGRRRN
jgi:hypothetical protein